MEILIINAHWNNRGDEAAIRALIDTVINRYPEANISLQILSENIKFFPYDKSRVKLVPLFPLKKNIVEILALLVFKSKFKMKTNTREFVGALEKADIIIHAPGGPSIGDIYYKSERSYLLRFLLCIRYKKSFFFYAPSLGPFKMKLRNIIRKYIFGKANTIVVRESISKQYLNELSIEKDIHVTLDSAIQNKIPETPYESQMKKCVELYEFINSSEKVIGITITDLMWNPKYVGQKETSDSIKLIFSSFLEHLIVNKFKIIFIPQLFGEQNDYEYMDKFREQLEGKNALTLDMEFDCYFQQYLISKLYAVVGMRYHSNIFSAKMKTPFISISYEQKMIGFMEKIGYSEYCIDINDLELTLLEEKFRLLVENYNEYKKSLELISYKIQKESSKTSDFLFDYLDVINNTRKNISGVKSQIIE